MRGLAVIFLVVAAAAAGAAVLALGSEEPAGELLPDLDQAAPQALALKHAHGRVLLTFGSAVDNVGAGPLVIEAARASRARATMAVRQVVERADGSRSETALGAVLRFERAETHAHWHLDDFERYELRAAVDSALVLRARKAGFCLGDRYETAASTELPGEPARPVWRRECGKERPGLLALREGISVGYGDDYAPLLEGQFVDVTDLPAGRYLLVHRANPEHLLRESEYRNNAASLLLQLRRQGRGGAPLVAILARCPDSDRCDAA